MKRKPLAKSDAGELRRRAEDKLGARQDAATAGDGLATQDAQRLVHELQVHQIELELQNEELQRARDEVEEGLARYTDLYELAPVGYLTLDRDGAILQSNLTGARLLGLERSRLVGRRLGLLTTAESRPAINAFFAKVFASEAKASCEVELDASSGAPIALELTGTAAAGGQECRGVATDITVRRRAEENFRALFREMLDGFGLHELICDDAGRPTDYRFLAVNPAYERLTGLKADDIVGRRALDVQPATEQQWIEACGQVALTGTPATFEHDFGQPPRSCEVTVFQPRPNQFACIICDITERKLAQREREELQAQLAQAQRLESIGTFAGGIAHDFNNILAGILGGLSLLELELDEGGAHHAEIQEMEALVERGAELTRQLLGFARRGKYDVRPQDLARVVNKTSAMFGRTHKGITIQIDIAPDLPAVLMDHSQLEQILMNLLVNAGQAMGDSGRLTLRAEDGVRAREEQVSSGAAPGRYVKLVVADSGIGMDAATQARIFDPFFTTKGPGEGTGLGLASVYGILKSHGGTITVESEPGKGAAFTLLLPATARKSTPEPVPAAAISRGMGTILVVDDDEQVLRTYTALLERIGYDVLAAASGEQALDLSREHGQDITLVILDMIMPGMSGSQTYDALQDIVPGTKVLLSSGYSIDSHAQAVLDRGCVGFIQKPFSMAELSVKLQEIL